MRKAFYYPVGIIVLLLEILCQAFHPALAEQSIAPGPFTDIECITCHQERDPELISQLSKGSHTTASGVGCSSCHGERHKGANENARKNQSCTGCHEGPASHSYATSKHGIINLLNEDRQDWKQPLQRGNYRVPTCSYCHLHNGDHRDTMAVQRGPEVRQWICSGCHSPRYVREQFANAKRQLEIADLKVTEGEELIITSTDDQTDDILQLQQTLNHHRRNILYGVGHQSPDYQWWHGQPALDGDLIRIRDLMNFGDHIRY